MLRTFLCCSLSILFLTDSCAQSTATSSFILTNSVKTETFRILDNGNVGIGISTPQTKLAVNGIISSQKILVTPTGWPDYVFDTAYKLPSLTQLEKYIRTNKHLPDIAPASEIKNTGLDLGNTQTALLKKIEELTLYLIQQDKQLQELKDMNKKLETQIINLTYVRTATPNLFLFIQY